MKNTPTPHIGAKQGEIAQTVLMPGDPLRAKFIAENFLQEIQMFNTVRNMFGFTGIYKGARVSVMGSGMGMPSMGIYSYELFNLYNVENIIRVGTAGAIDENVNVRDVIIAMGACTDSNYACQYKLPGTFAPIASYELLQKAIDAAKAENIKIHIGNVVSQDAFYCEDKEAFLLWSKMRVLAVEMEAAALYMNAARARKSALCILTVSDSLITKEALTAEQRQNTFTQMIKIALCCMI